MTLPSIHLPSTSHTTVDPSRHKDLTLIFCYPRTGAPDEVIPSSWNAIPGARGCTPQACSFRDEFSALQTLGVKHVYGISTQDSEYQREVKERVHLPYDLLSDEKLELVRTMRLPTMEWEGKTLVKRLTIAVKEGRVVRVWYPVFPPERSAGEVVEWLGREG
jgi:peroxiredoxin